MNCEFCNNEFSNKHTLIKHQKNTRYCLKLQNKEYVSDYKCEGCQKTFTIIYDLNIHMKKCKASEHFYNLQKEIDNLENTNKDLNYKVSEQEKTIEEQKHQIKELQDKLENIAIKAVSRPNFEDEAAIEIDMDSDDENEEDNQEDNQEKTEEYKLKPLDVGDGYKIENRESDGYINVTNLCKAGGKKFKHWNSLNRTDEFLRVLSSTVGIPTIDLVAYNQGGNGERHTWVHPQVAINIAQWISPQFDVKVSSWVYEIMITGKVDITNTKSYIELKAENKNHKIQIKKLTDKYVKSQPRVQYKENNVIYILTTPSLKKDRRYILGKATNLTNRLSTYNKTDEHEVMYYQECPDCESMSIVETMIFQKLKSHREQANRERFILPKEKTIDFFRDVVKNAIEYVISENN
jgi:uncharacterized coiled-coil protein SlyX